METPQETQLESTSWGSKLNEEEYRALWRWMKSWTIIRDALSIGECEFKRVTEPSYMAGYHVLFLSKYFAGYRTTIESLHTQMSVFLEGFRAARSEK